MLIKDVMKKDVITIPSHLSFIDVIHMFLEHDISGGPVVNPDGHVIGLVTEKDLLKAFYPSYQDYYEDSMNFLTHSMFFDKLDDKRSKPITDIMRTNIILAKPDNPVRYIGGKMVATGIHQAPVIDMDGLVGIVTRRDIYRALLNEQLHINVYANIYVDTNNSVS